ncbi:DUF167 domain-containing protein [Piscinibacter sp.]|uniref:DUF167 domain-containing protein n=1 Tax=Piscinibacter sp. TaxID=1903157 RepID=UPI0039E286B4
MADDELPACLTRHGERLWLAVSVVPNAKRTGADGTHDGALRVRLAAPPVDGKANETLLAWLADEFDVPRRALTLVRGATARRKWVEMAAPPPVVVEAVRRLLA